jgi:hypothetical protein
MKDVGRRIQVSISLATLATSVLKTPKSSALDYVNDRAVASIYNASSALQQKQA